MSLTAEIAPEIVAACQANATDICGSLGNALDAKLSVSVGEVQPYAAESAPVSWQGPGLAVVLDFGGVGLLALLPSESNIAPEWCYAPDPTGASKLSTLAQELGMQIVPETLFADDFRVVTPASLQAALAAATPDSAAQRLTLTLTAGEQTGELTLVWPVTHLAGLATVPPAAVKRVEKPVVQVAPTAAVRPPVSAPSVFRELPSYSRSLLKVTVPITVSLATKKQAVSEILALGPSSIIMFDKACDAPLEMTVAGHPIATGEAVKVGEKFGLKITSMILPEERFKPVTKNRAG